MTHINIHFKSARGFSLVEVMVALIVVAIGLLGLAKMESLALASTTTAGTRSIAALQASSMAAAMHANRAYWGSSVVQGTTTVTNASASPLVTACTANPSTCSIQQMAAYDVQNWSIAMNSVLPPYFATIICTTAGPPVNCNITIKWVENGVAIDTQQTNMANLALPTYTIFLEP
jgi:type IV pilus assembly protein PilV